MRVLCVIPARLASTRLPQKPLRIIAGEPLIRHVARRVLEMELGLRIVVASDDDRVCGAVAGLGVEAVLTGAHLGSGTERTAAVTRLAGYERHEVVVNVQGDEPLIEREAVQGALARVLEAGDDIGTAAGPMAARDLLDPDCVKVIVDHRGRARRFFRTPPMETGTEPAPLRHVGVYAYRVAALRRWVALPATAAERGERLEQLRPLAYGMSIGVWALQQPVAPGVDTAEQAQAIEHRLATASSEGRG